MAYLFSCPWQILLIWRFCCCWAAFIPRKPSSFFIFVINLCVFFLETFLCEMKQGHIHKLRRLAVIPQNPSVKDRCCDSLEPIMEALMASFVFWLDMRSRKIPWMHNPALSEMTEKSRALFFISHSFFVKQQFKQQKVKQTIIFR